MYPTVIGGNSWLKAFVQANVILLLAALVGVIVNQSRFDGLPLFSVDNKEGPDVLITLVQAKQEYFSGTTLVFVDARDSNIYSAGHITGARNLPYHQIDELFDQVMGDLSTDTRIATYCDGRTCSLGLALARELRNHGFRNVVTLENGWSLWLGGNLPIEQTRFPSDRLPVHD